MTRLQSQWQRLYSTPPSDGAAGVRALVLEQSRPADWQTLSAVWRGVQTELSLPAPAIAVSGTDGFQLWFSLADPVPATRACQFLSLLCARYLAAVAPARLTLWPQQDALAPPVPAEQPGTGNWSAFVAPDLAPVFEDTPWLDIPPGDDAQADVLSGLQPIRRAAFDEAFAQLSSSAPAPTPPATAQASASAPSPEQFLTQAMNDVRVDMALRIEAAKALLAHRPGSRPDR